MKFMARSLALLLGAGLLVVGGAESGAAGKGIPWQKNLKKAQIQAAKQKKIIMVDFTAPW